MAAYNKGKWCTPCIKNQNAKQKGVPDYGSFDLLYRYYVCVHQLNGRVVGKT